MVIIVFQPSQSPSSAPAVSPLEATEGRGSQGQGAIEEDGERNRPTARVANIETGGEEGFSREDRESGIERARLVVVSEPSFSSQSDQVVEKIDTQTRDNVERTDAQTREPYDLNVAEKEEKTSVLLSQEQVDAGGKPSPLVLVGLLVLFLFLYVGAEVGFGAWVAVVVLRDELATEAVAALMAR